MNSLKREYRELKENHIQLLWTDDIKSKADDMAAGDDLSRNEFIIRLIRQEWARRMK